MPDFFNTLHNLWSSKFPLLLPNFLFYSKLIFSIGLLTAACFFISFLCFPYWWIDLWDKLIEMFPEEKTDPIPVLDVPLEIEANAPTALDCCQCKCHKILSTEEYPPLEMKKIKKL